jgi:hypothetical protein
MHQKTRHAVETISISEQANPYTTKPVASCGCECVSISERTWGRNLAEAIHALWRHHRSIYEMLFNKSRKMNLNVYHKMRYVSINSTRVFEDTTSSSSCNIRQVKLCSSTAYILLYEYIHGSCNPTVEYWDTSSYERTCWVSNVGKYQLRLSYQACPTRRPWYTFLAP